MQAVAKQSLGDTRCGVEVAVENPEPLRNYARNGMARLPPTGAAHSARLYRVLCPRDGHPSDAEY